MLTAIIPARGGSKGICRKNMQIVGDKTLVALAVEKCLELTSQVIVSSDDADILAEAIRSGARGLERPARLSGDEATSQSVLRHAIDMYAIQGDILWVQCTAPLVTVDELRRCVQERQGADMAVLCHGFKGFVLDEGGRCVNRQLVPAPRRQDIASQYLIAGSGWSFDASYIRQVFYSGVVKPIVCSGPHCDIDEYSDLWTARAIERDRHPMPGGGAGDFCSVAPPIGAAGQ